MKKISVIIPAYNAEKYISKCLESILSQTFKDIEIIVVNDGSKDNTLSILNEYKENYPELIKVIDQQNQGQSVTRNNALKRATGKYIMFIDSDDYIKSDMFEKMYNKAVSGGYDVVASDVDCVYPDKTILIKSGIDEDTTELTLEQRKKIFLEQYPTVWNKIYKREIFDNEELFFKPGVWFEDVLFLQKLIPNIKSIGFIDESFYQYIQNIGSITYTYSDKLQDIRLVLNEIIDYYKKENIFEDYRDEIEYMYVRYMFATYIKRLSKAKDKKVFNVGVKFALSTVKEKFPNYKKNVYLNNGGLKNMYLKHFGPLISKVVYHFEKNKMN